MSSDDDQKPEGKPPEDPGHHDLVTVSIDGVKKEIPAGEYTTEQLKAVLGVDAQRELDVIEKGVFHPLKPGQQIKVENGMEFISRQPAGGSS